MANELYTVAVAKHPGFVSKRTLDSEVLERTCPFWLTIWWIDDDQTTEQPFLMCGGSFN